MLARSIPPSASRPQSTDCVRSSLLLRHATVASLERIAPSATDFRDRLKELCEAINAAMTQLQAHAKEARSLIEAELAKARDLSAQLRSEVTSSIEATKRVHDSLAKNAEFIVDRLGR